MKKVLMFACVVILFVSCKPSTEITGSWKNPNSATAAATERIQTILVTALSERTNARQTVEDDLASALEENGIRAVKSMTVLPPTFTNGQAPDKKELLSRIGETGADAILTVALIDKETESRYSPGSYNYAPIPRFGYYGTFWGYFNNWSPTLFSPGYYTEDKVYFIETNLYDAETEELLWSAQSETYNPGSLSEFSRDFAKVVVTSMKKDGLLQKSKDRDAIARDRETD